MILEPELAAWMTSHGYQWAPSKYLFILDRTDASIETEDILGALDAAYTFFEAQGDHLRKPLAYIFTSTAHKLSMVQRQARRRQEKKIEQDAELTRALYSIPMSQEAVDKLLALGLADLFATPESQSAPR